MMLLISHTLVAMLGFGVGIYLLPILTAPPAPLDSMVQTLAGKAQYSGQFRRDLADSDALHWGEGTLYVGPDNISLQGEIAPGPDYKLYLSPEFVETEAEFMRLKSTMMRAGEVKTFHNFIINIPGSIDLKAYNTVVIWCESFGQLITAARYQ